MDAVLYLRTAPKVRQVDQYRFIGNVEIHSYIVNNCESKENFHGMLPKQEDTGSYEHLGAFLCLHNLTF